MDPSLAVYLMAGLGANAPILEALNVSYKALNSLEYFKLRLMAKFKIDLDFWGPLEPGSANGYPLNLEHTEVLHVIYNITQRGPHYLARVHTHKGVATILIELDTPTVKIQQFLQEMALLLPSYPALLAQ